ncbi:MAG: hypothetical protein AAGG08_20135, partial [Actinomycetota bacterium]
MSARRGAIVLASASALTVIGCGSGEGDDNDSTAATVVLAAPPTTSVVPPTTATTEPQAAIRSDGLAPVLDVGSIDGFWIPFEVDGDPAPTDLGAFLRVQPVGDGLAITGNDGCNDFWIGGPVTGGPITIDGGVLG